MTNHRVLLVEDDADIRALFRLALQNDGFTVVEAADGLQAMALVQGEEFDAIVLDLSMPRIDGVSALDNFKMMCHGQTVPVVAVTALDDPAVEERAREAGAAAFLRKPLPPQHVVDAVRRHLPTTNEE